jgi:hypothetical protein
LKENCFEDCGEIVNISVFIQIRKGGPEADSQLTASISKNVISVEAIMPYIFFSHTLKVRTFYN